jgi:hypothetical protein
MWFIPLLSHYLWMVSAQVAQDFATIYRKKGKIMGTSAFIGCITTIYNLH